VTEIEEIQGMLRKKLDQNVDIGTWRLLGAGERTEERKLLHLIAVAEIGKYFAWDFDGHGSLELQIGQRISANL